MATSKHRFFNSTLNDLLDTGGGVDTEPEVTEQQPQDTPTNGTAIEEATKIGVLRKEVRDKFPDFPSKASGILRREDCENLLAGKVEPTKMLAVLRGRAGAAAAKAKREAGTAKKPGPKPKKVAQRPAVEQPAEQPRPTTESMLAQAKSTTLLGAILAHLRSHQPKASEINAAIMLLQEL